MPRSHDYVGTLLQTEIPAVWDRIEFFEFSNYLGLFSLGGAYTRMVLPLCVLNLTNNTQSTKPSENKSLLFLYVRVLIGNNNLLFPNCCSAQLDSSTSPPAGQRKNNTLLSHLSEAKLKMASCSMMVNV